MATLELKSIDKLFDLEFYIPSYQRGYRWDKTQIKELLEDLYDFKVTDNSYYCLQPVVVKKKDNYWEIVDGQQRLTAMWLISALYFCTNKGDVLNLEHKKYKLIYEEKNTFTGLFDDISTFIANHSLSELLNEFDSKKTSSIDSFYLIESLDCIANFSRNNKTAKGVLAEIFEKIKNIQIIWYALDKDEDAIQTFTNINANKIELTNAELIKANFIHLFDEDKKQNFAIQWENIEKVLNKEDVWAFISDEKKHYSTRIDYLFEIWCAKAENVYIDATDRYAIFRTINEKVSDVKKLWGEILEIFETLNDWFDDYFYFHAIGLLIELNDSSVDLIKELYISYYNTDKTSFKHQILSMIADKFFSKRDTTPFEILELQKIKNDLENITINNKKYVRDILLLYNIAILINANNTYERFPFDLYKKEKWDIEHINPQTPKDASKEEKIEWLNSYRNILSIKKEKELEERINNCLKTDLQDFDDVAGVISKFFGLTDNNSISNLALLDASTNRGYKNSCFSDKRKKIIDIERKRTTDEKYILIGTKWVFLKGYENSTQLVVWGESDMKDYTEDIAINIYTMLKEIGSNE